MATLKVISQGTGPVLKHGEQVMLAWRAQDFNKP